MWQEKAALAVSFVVMLIMGASYFVKQKSWYLALQNLGIVGLGITYLFTGEMIAMVGMGISLIRTLTYYGFERKNIRIPVWLMVVFSVLSIASFFIVNAGDLQNFKFYDILFLVVGVAYTVIFSIRSMRLVRFLMLGPIIGSIVYNLLARSTPFVVISYTFELCASLAAIVKYELLQKEKKNEN